MSFRVVLLLTWMQKVGSRIIESIPEFGDDCEIRGSQTPFIESLQFAIRDFGIRSACHAKTPFARSGRKGPDE